MDRKVEIQCNKIFHLEESMIMYGICNSDTLEQLIETVHKMHNTTSCHEKIFAGKIIIGLSGISIKMELAIMW